MKPQPMRPTRYVFIVFSEGFGEEGVEELEALEAWEIGQSSQSRTSRNPEYINLLDTSGVCGWIQGAYGLI